MIPFMLALGLSLAAAASEPAARQSDDDSALVERTRQALEKDPEARAALVERIMGTKIAGSASRADAERYVAENLARAAEISVGLDRDKRTGTHTFEETFASGGLRVGYQAPRSKGGAIGVLQGAAKGSSQAADQEDPEIGDEERQEKLRDVFEGKGSAQGKVAKGGSGAGGLSKGETLAGNYYDRLSGGNLRGYSAQLVALQNELNRSRPPGAPALVETGRLDYPTLAYPMWSLRWDIGRLRERAASGGPAVEPLSKAEAALAAFEAAAARAKDPNAVTRALLGELADLRLEAARWIALAAIEEQLVSSEGEASFLTPELLAEIGAAPAPTELRAAYRRRGEELEGRGKARRAALLAAKAALLSPAWRTKIAEADSRRAKAARLGAGLAESIGDYRAAPGLLASSTKPRPRWKRIWEDTQLKLSPLSESSRAIARERVRLGRARDAFAAIADGRFPDARAALHAP